VALGGKVLPVRQLDSSGNGLGMCRSGGKVAMQWVCVVVFGDR
jgi:hypothetical protein